MSRPLTVVRNVPARNAPAAGEVAACDLDLLVAGLPVLIEKVDLIAFANTDRDGLDPTRDPDSYTLAEVMLDWYHRHVGTDRRTKGDRATNLAVTLRRYLLPFALETGHRAGTHQVGAFRVQHAEMLASILAGTRPLPAGTVAGDQLGRYGIDCVWLTLADAGQVSDGGTDAVARATRDGRLTVYSSPAGERIVAAADLRTTGLLRERRTPHGLDRANAANHLRVLSETLARAIDLGATITGNFSRVRAVEPLADARQRPQSDPLNGAVTIDATAAVCAYLSPVMQVALWLLRLTGMRIGEAYGLRVEDYRVDADGRGWLRIHTQGGSESLVRDELGKLRVAASKPHTKTKQSVRTIPIPALLRRLLDEVLRAYHADLNSGFLDPSARLIPGLRSDDNGGTAALRVALSKAITAVTARGYEVPKFTPHDLRASWITDMYDQDPQVAERVHEWYTGHAVGTTVHRGYDLGPEPEQWTRVVDIVDENAAAAGVTDLRRPTATREGFGRGTRRGAQADRLRAELAAVGWLLPRGALPPLPETGRARTADADGELLDTAGVAQRADVALGTARRWLREGAIPAVPSTWGRREVLRARVEDVDAFLARRQRGTTLAQLSATTGWSYHQLFRILDSIGVTANSRLGGGIRLTDAQADAVLTEVNRRVCAARQALPVTEAATRLGMTVLTVETLLRRGELDLGETPDDTRHRYITVASIDAYLAAHPHDGDAADGPERLVPQGIVREALHLTRPQLRFLVASRQLAGRTPGRRLCITFASIERYAAGQPKLADAVLLCLARSRLVRDRLQERRVLPAQLHDKLVGPISAAALGLLHG